MLSELVLSLALLGGVRDHLDDDGVKEASATSLTNMNIHVKEDLELVFDRNHQIFLEMLDLNRDGIVDVYELAVLELDGAEVTEFELSDSEALILADGAVREDGELETDHVDLAHFRNWFVDTVWSSLISEADKDGDEELSTEEWAEYSQSVTDLLKDLHAPAHETAVVKKADNGSMMDAKLPENAAEALVAAGSVFSQVVQANSSGSGSARRRLWWWVIPAVKILIGAVNVGINIYKAAKSG